MRIKLLVGNREVSPAIAIRSNSSNENNGNTLELKKVKLEIFTNNNSPQDSSFGEPIGD